MLLYSSLQAHLDNSSIHLLSPPTVRLKLVAPQGKRQVRLRKCYSVPAAPALWFCHTLISARDFSPRLFIHCSWSLPLHLLVTVNGLTYPYLLTQAYVVTRRHDPSRVISLIIMDADAVARRTALIAYGTETGNAQDAAEEVARLCERLRFKTHMLELDLISLVCG